jgi:hypothetical protein
VKRLAVVAHYDPRGAAAPHFLRQLDQLDRHFDDVVVATTSTLTDDARTAIGRRARVVERPNVGHDFGSWRDVLEHSDYGRGYDELLLTNDSYVGYLRPFDEIVSTMRARPVELWGITRSRRHAEHVQSYFLYFTSESLHSQAFHRFWSELQPAASRMQAILNQEIGVSQTLISAGFRIGSYFEPTTPERRLANLRGIQWMRMRMRAFPTRFDSFEDSYFRARQWNEPGMADNLNWSAAFADFALDGGRLPVVKFDTLRYDPYWLGSGDLLDALEKRFPEAFDGVREFLAETSGFYGQRRYENGGPARLGAVPRLAVGYRTRRGASA